MYISHNILYSVLANVFNLCKTLYLLQKNETTIKKNRENQHAKMFTKHIFLLKINYNLITYAVKR